MTTRLRQLAWLLLALPLLPIAACGDDGGPAGDGDDGAGGGVAGTGGGATGTATGGSPTGGTGDTTAAGPGGGGDASTGTGDATSAGGAGGASSTGTTTSGAGGAPADEPAPLTGITAAHNVVRANVDPPAATPIPPLTWDPELAAVAQAHAEECVFEHSFGPYGENLFASTSPATGQEVVDLWAFEAQWYDYESNSCSGVCGHYTQVVWADSLRLGCGMALCTTGSPFEGGDGEWESWVCNYDPRGNLGGTRPY